MWKCHCLLTNVRQIQKNNERFGRLSPKYIPSRHTIEKYDRKLYRLTSWKWFGKVWFWQFPKVCDQEFSFKHNVKWGRMLESLIIYIREWASESVSDPFDIILYEQIVTGWLRQWSIFKLVRAWAVLVKPNHDQSQFQ